MLHLILSCIALGSLFHPLEADEMPEPYCSLRMLFPFDEHGWYANEPHLKECFARQKIETVIEVGSWLGLSTRDLAVKVGPAGKVYAIDTWLGSPSEDVHQKDPRLPQLYEIFLSNVIHTGLTQVIVPIRMDSLEAAKILDVKADLIYIDASHVTEAVYQDIIHWYPHLKEGGVFCGDDFCWGSVAAGVRKGAEELNLDIETGYTWWRLKPKQQ